jgi:hypothetical protein
MRKSAAAMLALLFMAASCMTVKPALSSADDPAENTWVSKASMQVARSSLGVAVVNGKIYAIGGYAENGVVGTNEEYDAETDTWTYKSSMPTPMGQFATAAYQNRIYCISGNVSEVYDPATDTWETREPMPTPRSGVGANVVNGKIYVTGGYVPNSSSLTGSSFVSLNEVYDPETDSWTTKAEVPTAVVSSRSAVVDSKIYIIQNDLTQIYDAVTDTWSLGTPLPYSSSGFKSAVATAGVYAPKRIYVFGGGETQVYDPETDSWTFGTGMLTKRVGFGVAVVSDMLYVIGGYTAAYSNNSDYWMFGPEITLYATNERYTPFGYGTPDPSYDGVAPLVAVVTPVNRTYYTADVGLNFTDIALDFAADEPVFSVHYVLDGGTPVEISGNTTLTGLAVGAHNVTVSAFDASGNMGTSETVFFAIAEPEPFPVVLVATASGASLAALGVGLLLYFRRRNR